MNYFKKFILIAASVFSVIVQAAPVASSGNLRIEVPALDRKPSIKINLSARKDIRDKQLKLMREYLEVSNLNRSKSSKKSVTSFCSSDEEGETECEYYDDFYVEIMEREWYAFADGSGNVELERQVSVGESVCTVIIRGGWGMSSAACDDAESLGDRPEITSFSSSVGKAGAAVAAAAVAMVEYISPVLPNCAKSTIVNPIKTPDQDRAKDWWLAKSAVAYTYGGNFGSIFPGARIDVLYPNDDVVRFIVVDVDRESKYVDIVPFINGNPSDSNNRCK